MKLILLPAFDGTGQMFSNLVRVLSAQFDCVSVSYPETGPQDYLSLTEQVIASLPESEDYIVLGESFAGPIVYQLVIRDLPRCKGAVFVATYLTNPRPLVLKFLTALPAFLISLMISRPWVVKLVSLSRDADSGVAKAIAKNFASVKPTVIKQRLKTIAGANDQPRIDVAIPSFYIQADHDGLVLPKKLKEFRQRCQHLTLRSAPGGHFVLQESPAECAKILLEELVEFKN